jgi:hypothetical protein
MTLDYSTTTVENALALLESLKPQLHALLAKDERATVKVKLEALDVLKMERKRGEDGNEDINAHVLYLRAQHETDEETMRLKRVCGKEIKA